MKKTVTIAVVIFLLAVFSTANSQTNFEKWIGEAHEDIGYCIIPVSTGGYVIAGSWTEELSSEWDIETDACLIKIDENGEIAWRSMIATIERYTSADKLYKVVETSDGYFMATGVIQTANAVGAEDLLLAKFDANGDTVWTKRYDWDGYDKGRGLIELDDGSFIIAGEIGNLSSANDLLLMKIDANGDSVWVYRDGGDYDDRAFDIAETQDGNFIAVGYTAVQGGYVNKCWILEFDTDGNKAWDVFGSGDDGYDIEACSDGNFIVTQKDGIMKMDGDGTELWRKTGNDIGGIGGATLHDAVIDANGDILLIGHRIYWVTDLWTEGNEQLMFAKLSTDGEILWTSLFGLNEGAKSDEGYSIAPTADGGYIATGFTCQGDGDDIYLVKIDGTGATAIGDESLFVTPDEFSLHQNYPNPFNPETKIEFTLPKVSEVKIEIYNIAGQKVRTLFNGVRPAGLHSVVWNGTGDSGNKLSSGVYVYKIKAGDYTTSRKMILLK